MRRFALQSLECRCGVVLHALPGWLSSTPSMNAQVVNSLVDPTSLNVAVNAAQILEAFSHLFPLEE